MTTQRAVLTGFSLLAMAIVVVGLAPTLRASSPASVSVGTWQISAVPGSIAWKLNTVSGELFYCSGISCDRAHSELD